MTNIRNLLICATAQLLLLSVAGAAELSTAQAREIIAECQQLVSDYAYYRDLRDADRVAELFAENGRMMARNDDPDTAVVLDNFAVVGKYVDTFTRTDEGWKIAERVFTPIFPKPAAEADH